MSLNFDEINAEMKEDEKEFISIMESMGYEYREDGQFSEQGMKEYIEQIRKNNRDAIALMTVKEEDL